MWVASINELMLFSVAFPNLFYQIHDFPHVLGHTFRTNNVKTERLLNNAVGFEIHEIKTTFGVFLRLTSNWDS